MDRNLGASQVATSKTDRAAYGDLFQWGRLDDGHQVRSSNTTTTLSSSDVPGHDKFIIGGIIGGSGIGSFYDWRSSQNDNLWQGVNGINNPCPDGWRVPTKANWEAEMSGWSYPYDDAAYNSPLKLTLAGYRDYIDGSLFSVGSYGRYWSSTPDGSYASSTAAIRIRSASSGPTAIRYVVLGSSLKFSNFHFIYV